MRRPSILALVTTIAVAGTAMAQKPIELRISDTQGGAQKATFKPDVPKVFAAAKLEGIPAGKPLRCDWIAVKVEGAPENYKIDSWQGKSASGQKDLTCSFSKPTAGWPVGDYRVDLFVDGKGAGKATFKVAK